MASATSGRADSLSMSAGVIRSVVASPALTADASPTGRTMASDVEPLTMFSKVALRPVLKVLTPARKPMPSTMATVLISRRTLRASRLRQVRRSTSARRLHHRGVLQAGHLGEDLVAVGVAHLVNDHAVREKEHAVGVRRRDRVVAHHHDGLTELVDTAPQEGEDLRAAGRVEVAGGLVGEDDLRTAHERAGTRDALLLAPRHLT